MPARAILPLLLLGACAAPGPRDDGGTRFTRAEMLEARSGPAPHAWLDPAHGYRVESDFSPGFFAPLIALWVQPRVAVYREVFGVRDLSELVVRVHDRPPVSRDVYLVNGFHVGDEVHVFAGAVEGAWGARPGDQRGLETLAHELVHAFVAQSGVELDRWLEEGLCEVLSDVRLDVAGTPWIWPDSDNEIAARRLVLDDAALCTDALVRHRASYPPPDELSVFYVQAESFTAFLLRERAGPLRARIDAVRGLDARELTEAGARWLSATRELDLAALHAGLARSGDPELERATLEAIGRFARTPAWWGVVADLAASRSGPDVVLDVVELLRDETVGSDWWRVFGVIAARPEPVVRRRSAEVLLGAGQDDIWWGVARDLLHDADVEVRRTVRHILVLAPMDRPETWRELAIMRLDSRAEVRLAAALALARLGEPSAGVAFLAGLAAEPDPSSWVFDLAQLQLAFPGYPHHPDLGEALTGEYDLATYAVQFAIWVEEHQTELVWRPHARRYSLRPGQ